MVMTKSLLAQHYFPRRGGPAGKLFAITRVRGRKTYRSDNREGGGGGILGLLVTAIVAPLAATIIQMAISRTREYAADETGARLSGYPSGLALALGKLGAASEQIPLNASPQTAHLFMVNPLSGRSLMQLFSTHPPLEERIARLQAMAGQRA
jgi:heat shock protein HtpX